MKRALAFFLCTAAVFLYCSRVVKTYAAAQAANSEKPGGALRAVRLDPENAEYLHQLGLELSLSNQDQTEAIENLRQAVRLNADSGRNWLDLASAYEVAGDASEKDAALEAALRAEPGNPEITAEVAQYYLAAGNTSRALPLIRQVLNEEPDLAADILRVAWQGTHDAKLLLDRAVPSDPELRLVLLLVLAQQNDAAAARLVWNQLIVSGRSFSPKLGFFYLDYLLRSHATADLVAAWTQLAALSPTLHDYLPGENLIVNSGFELPFLNAGFDWRYTPVEGVDSNIDDSMAHTGRHSLELHYDGRVVADAGWRQLIAVQPSETYDFSAWIMSQDVVTSSGPRIAIDDAYTGASLMLTDDIFETHPWQQLTGTLRVPASTELARVRITRVPAQSGIQGDVWIDDLQLKRVHDPIQR